jgi:hypothetical protein
MTAQQLIGVIIGPSRAGLMACLGMDASQGALVSQRRRPARTAEARPGRPAHEADLAAAARIARWTTLGGVIRRTR